MAKYLKPKQEYIDLYDRLTVEDCRWRENFHKNSKPSEELAKEVSEKFYNGVTEIALHYDLLYTTIQWYEDKDKTITEWIDRDTRKDELYENAEAPRGIRCLKCQSLTAIGSKILYDHNDAKGDRVLFIYDCPNGCVPHRAFFNDGEEYEIKPSLCPKCNSTLERSDERIENRKIITIETCSGCGYTKTDEMELSMKDKEKPDPDYEKDRERFCLSGEKLSKNLQEKSQLEGMARFMDEWKEKDKYKDQYEEVAKLQKLTVVDLEKLLVPILEKASYIKFQFGQPDMGKDLFLPFTTHDAMSERRDMASTHDLQKLLKKALEDTNWRLMSEGTSYRVGILSGRLRAYEREEDQLELIRLREKKLSKVSKL
ncbi:MAG: hypothetical protein ABL917_03220 [Parcubacteria group bacterium]